MKTIKLYFLPVSSYSREFNIHIYPTTILSSSNTRLNKILIFNFSNEVGKISPIRKIEINKSLIEMLIIQQMDHKIEDYIILKRRYGLFYEALMYYEKDYYYVRGDHKGFFSHFVKKYYRV